MKKRKNDFKKMKLNKNVISHFKKSQITGGTLLTDAGCTTSPTDILPYSKIDKICDTRYCETKSCEPTEIACSKGVCL